MFGSGGILGNDFGVPPANSNKELITVRHLLEHKSGFTNNDKEFNRLPRRYAFNDDVRGAAVLSRSQLTDYYYD